MCNSPTMCQIYIAWALEPVQKQFPNCIIYHFMDDIVVAAQQLNYENVLASMTTIQEQRGLRIAPEKAQCSMEVSWVAHRSSCSEPSEDYHYYRDKNCA